MKLLNDNELYLVSGGKTKSECNDDLLKHFSELSWRGVSFVLNLVKLYSGVIMSWNAFVTAIGYGYHKDYDAKGSGTPDPNDYRLKNHLMTFIKESTELK